METVERLVACYECAATYQRTAIPARASAHCRRCGGLLYRHIPDTLNRSLALNLAALMLWLMANLYPFIGLQVAGVYQENLLLTGGWALYEYGMGELGLVVFLTSVLFPFLAIAGMIYLLLPICLGYLPPRAGLVFQSIKIIEPWCLISVFMLGTLIAIVKLQDLAQVLPGFSLAAFTALLIVYTMARSSFDAETFWQRVEALRGIDYGLRNITASDRVLHCHICDGLQTDGHDCQRCGASIHHRIENSIQRTWALLCAATLMLIPANIFPVMTVKKLGMGQPDTIISGITALIEAGLYGLGIIVLFASVIVPIAKLGSVIYLLRSIQNRSTWRPKDRTQLYRVTEAIGSWSMVDVFLVGLLAGLVSLGILASVTPGIGATFFGAAVILTMFAAQQFDPRLIWDALEQAES